MPKPACARPRTVGILGGGFAGLFTALALQRKMASAVEITLFDRNNYFLYTPMLHEMATGTVNPRHVVVPLRKVLNPRSLSIRCETVLRVELKDRALVTPAGRFDFDALILSPGSVSAFHGLPGAETHSVTFKAVGDAVRTRNALIEMLEQGALEQSKTKKRDRLTVTVVGGGCTGVELVSEIAQFLAIILRRDYPEIHPGDITVQLLEATGKILGSFPDYLSATALARLEAMGVQVVRHALVREVTPDRILLDDGRSFVKGLLLWTGGIRARDLTVDPPADKDASGRFLVNEGLEIPGYSGVYVLGDAARTPGTPLPSTASVAVQQAAYAASSVAARCLGGTPLPPFRFRYRGDMASLGFMFGVCEAFGWHLRGFPAWLFWKIFKLAMLPRIKNRLQILADWLITLLFRRDTSRLA